MQRRLGVLLILISAVAFGTLALFARIAGAAGTDTPTLMLLRFAMAGAILFPICLIAKQPWPKGKTLTGLIVMGVVLYVGQSFTYFTAITMIKVSTASLLLYLYPGLVTIASALIFKERLTRIKLVALGMAVVGSFLTIGEVPQGSLPGIIWGAMAAVFYSTYILVGSRLMHKASPLPAATIIILSAAVFYAVFVAISGPHVPQSNTGWFGVVGVAVASVIAISCFLAGLERIGPVNSSTLSALEPVVVTILAVLFLNEGLHWFQVLGGALILCATVILARAPVTELTE